MFERVLNALQVAIHFLLKAAILSILRKTNMFESLFNRVVYLVHVKSFTQN